MIRMDFTDREAEILVETLRRDVTELRVEIAGTEHKPFRDELKHKEAVLKRMIGRLETAGAPLTEESGELF